MKFFRSARTQNSRGFSLVEAALSVGVFSFGCIGLAPLLSLGFASTKQARDSRVSAQIAENLTDQARAGTLATGTVYLDDQGVACSPATACYQVLTTETGLAGNCTRLTIQVTPAASPTRPLDYAVVLPPP